MTKKVFQSFASLILALAVAFVGVIPAYADPSNDNFADATQITNLPFSLTANTTGATFEPNEPNPTCNYWGYPLKTVWFAYTPSSNTALTVRTSQSNITPILGVYTGSSLDSLTPEGCQYFGFDFTFQPQAGQTYYFQLSGVFGDEGNISFTLGVTPPPQVNINYGPSDPSIFDNVWFDADTYDPGQIYGFTYAWIFSDGTTSDQDSFYHQFAADGDYAVNLTATTSDGRTGLASQIVHVRTKDVAITSFSIPQTARVNQTKTISVDIQNKRYSDYVQVTLSKGTPGGGDIVIGTLTIYVPARASRPTTFKFSYTFTSDDAAIGKVTFKAIATIVNARDALPADNTAISTTTISR